MSDRSRSRLPDGSTRAGGRRAPPPASWPRTSVAGSAKAAVIAEVERRPSATSSWPLARRRRGRHRHGRQRPRALHDPPLDGPRARPGGARPVPRRHVRHRPAGRGRLLLRLRAAPADGGRHVHAGRPRADRGPHARDHRGAQPFVRDEIADDEARELFADHPFKLEIIDGEADGPDVGDARPGSSAPTRTRARRRRRKGEPSFIDLCRGPHVPHTEAASATSSSCGSPARTGGATRSNPQLQRIYGTAWASKKATSTPTSHRLEEAAKRDHRKLGVELDLFRFPDEIGSGLAVFHPKGGLVRRLMEDYSRQRHEEAGYEFVNSPHITKADLFETSGHLDWFADGMFPPMHARRRARRGGGLLPQADELPVPHPHLPEPAAVLPRAAAAAVRVRHGVPLREVRRGPRASRGCAA